MNKKSKDGQWLCSQIVDDGFAGDRAGSARVEKAPEVMSRGDDQLVERL